MGQFTCPLSTGKFQNHEDGLPAQPALLWHPKEAHLTSACASLNHQSQQELCAKPFAPSLEPSTEFPQGARCLSGMYQQHHSPLKCTSSTHVFQSGVLSEAVPKQLLLGS